MISLNEEFRRLSCSQCGIIYFFPEKWCDTAANEKTAWECPNGHGQQFTDSEADRLRRERDRLAQRIAEKDDEIAQVRGQRDSAEHQARAFKGHVTRIRNRIGHGVCPCCNRTFENLHRHMASEHPDFSKEAAE